MKKIALLFLVVVLSVGLAGCPGSKDEDAVGTWIMTYDWECNGSADSVVWHLYDNGTFISSSGSNGSYDVSGNDITVNYSNGQINHGDINGDSILGTMIAVNGRTGCWAAQRISNAP